MTTSGNRRTVAANQSDLLSKRSKLRQLILENLEHRQMMAADSSGPIFAPGTSQAYVDEWIDRLGGNSSASNQINLSGSRWTNPVGGPSPNQGDPARVTWSIVPDGTATEDGTPSDLIRFMDGIYGGGNVNVVSQKPWFQIFDRAYSRWGEISGLTMVYEPSDDGAAMTNDGTSRGVAGVRGDMRISGGRIDGDSNVLAFNFFPNNGGNVGSDGDMKIDTADNFYTNNSDGAGGENRALFNVLTHESGHGIGLGHVIPTNETKLMEPFVSFAYLGPQHDDIIAAQTLYGDDSENNDSSSTATNLGTLGAGTISLPQRSIDNRTDVDYYGFRTSGAEQVTITVRPIGFRYDVGPQGGTASATDSLRYKNLSFQVEDQLGNVLGTANTRGLGQSEELVDFTIPEAGAYRLRVNGAGAADTQLYDLLLKVAPRDAASNGPRLVGVQPNNNSLLNTGDVLTVAPREMVFRFDDNQIIQANSLQGIRITRAGGDGSFGLNSVATDFGSKGKVDIQLTSKIPGKALTVEVRRANNLSAPVVVGFNSETGLVTLTLNATNIAAITGNDLISAINSDTNLRNWMEAKLNGGLGDAPIGTLVSAAITASSNSRYVVEVKGGQTNDIVVEPGVRLVGDAPNQNEVTFRFAENLPDDYYRIEIFGFDDAGSGVVGLKGSGNKLFVPSVAGARKETIDFRLDLGPRVLAVVPQPVLRVNDVLTQQRDTVVVYFDSDKLLVENTSAGVPTSRSVENPAFYKLIIADDSPAYTDVGPDSDVFLPDSVVYNASANTATLKFSTDLANLLGTNTGAITYRLRVGNRESAPLTPSRIEATATAITDLNTGGAATLRFLSKQVGEVANPITLVFENNQGGNPSVTVNGTTIVIDMGRDNLTAQQLINAIRSDAFASALISVELEPGSVSSTIVGNRNLSYSPVALQGLGSSYDAAMNLGSLGSTLKTQSSLIVSSSIDPETYVLDLPGASDDAGHRTLSQNVAGSLEDHINPNFGADATDGITTIYYNFKHVFAQNLTGDDLLNSMDDGQKARAREALGLWAKYIGVQFVETADLGLTIATGSMDGLMPVSGTQVQRFNNLGFGVRIDKTFDDALIIMQSEQDWDFTYGQDYFRVLTSAVGLALGLGYAGDLPETTLMRLDPTFLSGSGSLTDLNDAQLDARDEKYEPVFPGNQDVLHGRYLYRDDGSDIDLYRFEVDLGNTGTVGLFVAESFAERLANSSSLDTNLQLYRQTQATGSTNFALGDSLRVEFTSVRPGEQGNQLQIFFTQTDRGGPAAPSLTVFPNAISIDLNSNQGNETTVGEILSLLSTSSAASKLVVATLVKGDASTAVGGNILPQTPVVMRGGQMELIAQNDDYFSNDSVIRAQLGTGVYYLGVSASGNDQYNASIPNTGSGGKSQGNYEIRMTFRGGVDIDDAIQDLSGSHTIGDVEFLHPAVGIDGDSDGISGGVYDFWFQTAAQNRVLNFTSGGSPSMEGTVVAITGGNGVLREFEYSRDTTFTPGRIRIAYLDNQTPAQLATALAAAINGQSSLGVTATVSGTRITLRNERIVNLQNGPAQLDAYGKTIFVDKVAASAADGSLTKPFNNISGGGVANAFAAAMSGDIVRIVGNGGTGKDIATLGDNFAYEIGSGQLPGQILSDGANMLIPQGVTVMVDAGTIFKLNQAHIVAGSSSLDVNRSQASLQVLGTPYLLDNQGNALKNASGDRVPGRVYFTSWLDQTIGNDNYGPNTTPGAGNWGGISLRRDVDVSAGRRDKEDVGIFLNYINYSDIRYGGGAVLVNTVQQTVNPIEMLETRPTITNNLVQFSSSAAMSALPNSFEETTFNEPRFQVRGEFTSDYDRVGPEIYGNTLRSNSVNGLFIRIPTAAGGSPTTLIVPGRFDDTDITHVITENLVIQGAAGGALLDSTVPPSDLISLAATGGGSLAPGNYNYKITFVDRNGYESVPSNASAVVSLLATQTAVLMDGLPAVSGDYVGRRLYRSSGTGVGPYTLVGILDKSTTTFTDNGESLDGILTRDRVDVSTTIPTQAVGGTLAAGTYNYRVVMIDDAGREGLASDATVNVVLAATGSIQVSQIPLTATASGYTGRRLYRSSSNGQGPYVLVAELLDRNSTQVLQTTFDDNGSDLGKALSPESLGVKRPRLNASLVIDPGAVIKLQGARIETTMGGSLIAEGNDGLPVVFTSVLDDRYGGSGTFDTNNNLSGTLAQPRDWGGVYMAAGSTLSLDRVLMAYAGGTTRVDGSFRAFNTIEVQQADARIANSVFENNADGFGGQGSATRSGRLSNSPATIFVRGAQPTILGNIFKNNDGSAITIDANSMIDDIQPDSGRQTGAADRDPRFAANHGPLIRDNRMIGNDLNGMEIRAGVILTTESVWDDTDIVHVVTEGIFVQNLQHEGGLRLQSEANESLVVKFDGYGSNFNPNLGAGLTARGDLASGNNRVGGTLQVVGQPGFPVILTSIHDDTVGAGLQPDGKPQTDTNNNGIATTPQSADWRGLFLDQYSNDRNVLMALEEESPASAAPGRNGTVGTAQALGALAPRASAGNENLRLGFTVEGILSQSKDVDIYSFTAEAGTEIWIDIDRTESNANFVLDLLDSQGNLLAQSDSSTLEAADPNLIVKTSAINAVAVNPMPSRANDVRMTAAGAVKEDGTTNVNDPGLRVRLPGANNTRTTFYFRVRSAGIDIANVDSGLSSGTYQVQVRLQEAQEFAGSIINYADIRYAMNGVHLQGLPSSSPLMGEVGENESANSTNNLSRLGTNNGVAIGGVLLGDRPQYIGNIQDSALGGFSIAGTIDRLRDVDFYAFSVGNENVVQTGLYNNAYVPVVFDLDYADGFDRADTSINIFIEEPSQYGTQYRLVYSGDSSNIADDQARPLSGSDTGDLSRGSAGTKDGYIGPVALEPGRYVVGISSGAYQPRTKILNPFSVSPISSIRRLVDEAFVQGVSTAEPPVVQNFFPRTNIGPTGSLQSTTFNLGAYSPGDEPALYMDYTFSGGTFGVFVRDSAGVETQIGFSSGVNQNLSPGSASFKASLRDFAGRDGLSIVLRGTNANTRFDSFIIGFAERGEQIGVGTEPILLQNGFVGQNAIVPTRTFSLVNYEVIDQPQVAFNYEIIDGDLDVFIVDRFGVATRLATSGDDIVQPPEVLLVDDTPTRVLLDISRWAGQPGLRIEFRGRDADPTTILISDVLIELIDGSRVASGEANSTYGLVPVPSTMITTGAYQLEIRQAENFFESNVFGSPVLTKTWDTNDRFADQITLVAPRGADLSPGDKFEITDGGGRRIFEFTLTGSVGLGNVPVRYVGTDSAAVIANKIRDAVNNPTVQSTLKVIASKSSGIASGTSGLDRQVNLMGKAGFRTIQAANPAGQVQVITHMGYSDQNIQRDQGQVIIQNNFIRDSRDYAIWSQAARRLTDPRDQLDPAIYGSFMLPIGGAPVLQNIMQDLPGMVSTQAVRNLPVLNDDVSGGLVPGLVIQNNLLEAGGLGGVNLQGESPIWMISPSFVPATDPDPTTSATGTHFGSFLDDGDMLWMDSDRTRVQFEFEDIAGAGTGNPDFGSGAVQGNGYRATSAPIYYREDAGTFYNRVQAGDLQPFGTTALETVQMMRDGILGSAFVGNGTTQTIDATVSRSLLGARDVGFADVLTGYPNYFISPALYVEGISAIQFVNSQGGGNPFDIVQLGLSEAPQPHARIVNNTIVGQDGRASFSGDSEAAESNDTIASAIETWQGTAHNPLNYTVSGSIGDNTALIADPSQDVDFYQFKLDVGERVLIDIDTPSNSTLDSVMQIFDSRGIAQSLLDAGGNSVLAIDNSPAPGESTADRDPYIDFTATAPGVYYVAISAIGNITFDPLSMANRKAGNSSGDYNMTLSVRHPQQFTITAEHASAYAQGDTFTIYQIPDSGSTASAARTFEFTFNGQVSSGNIPIQLDPGWFFVDVARAIAKAVNEGDGGQPVLRNEQFLPNGEFGTANPIPPVTAFTLGGIAPVFDANLNEIDGDVATLIKDFGTIDELGLDALSKREIERRISGTYRQVNQGLDVYPRRDDEGVRFVDTVGFNGASRSNRTSQTNLGLGHDRQQTVPVSLTSTGDGTSEKYVVIKNAAYIESRGSILVDPDANQNSNLDQYLPETGVLATRGASPTLLNNVFFNVQTPIVAEESRVFPITGAMAPFGTNNPNVVAKPGQVVVGGSVYQYSETAIARNRYATGIEQGPTNVPNTALDQNVVVVAGEKLFVNAQGGNYIPVAGSRIIDSSIDSMPERTSISPIKQSVGIPASPILTPVSDIVGLIRVDDPSVNPSGGQGLSIFKDRGAFDRADFEGPAAILLSPVDNDALGVDRDGSVSFVKLEEGVYPEFRIQLADGKEPSNPFIGIGINDDTVVSSIISGLRLSGATVTVFENGRLLEEGLDYRFTYNTTRNEIILTPLAGVWKNGRVYEISLNNKDRFVLELPSGASIQDGQLVGVADADGVVHQFEFDSGYRLQIPQGLELQIPVAGGSAGGVLDGEVIEIRSGNVVRRFEFDRNVPANLNDDTNIRIAYTPNSSQLEIGTSLVAAIQAAFPLTSPALIGAGRIALGAPTGTTVLLAKGASVTQPTVVLGLEVPERGVDSALGVDDGQSFTISDGATSVLFEFDTDGSASTGSVAIDISDISQAEDVADRIISVLSSSLPQLNILPQKVASRFIRLGLPSQGSVGSNSRMKVVGVSKTIADGEIIEVGFGSTTKRFEFSTDTTVGSGNVRVAFQLTDTQDEIADALVAAIQSETSLALNARHFGDGNVVLGGTESHRVSVAQSPSVGLFGRPGVQSSTTLSIVSSTRLEFLTGQQIADSFEDHVFTVLDANGRPVIFEFDTNLSNSTVPGSRVIQISRGDTKIVVATKAKAALDAAGLGITVRNLGTGVLDLGILAEGRVNLGDSGIILREGTVQAGDVFSIRYLNTIVEFEFDNTSDTITPDPTRVAIRYNDQATISRIRDAMRAAIEDAGISLSTTTTGVGSNELRLIDSSLYEVDVSSTLSLRKSGVPGGATRVSFDQDANYSGALVAQQLIDAINSTTSTTGLHAVLRGGSTIFVENATSIESSIQSYFIQAIKDLAGNILKPNRINNDTRFTILMPGHALDYGDAPDPNDAVLAAPGRYPTQLLNDGARHVITAQGPILGTSRTAEDDSVAVDAGDDGVTFTSTFNPLGVFNPNVDTTISVQVSKPSYVDAWIDFNADGDFDDPQEQVLTNVRFDLGSLEQTFIRRFPSSAAAPTSIVSTFGRFRVSSEGNLQPFGLAVDGEVEDYLVTIVPGTPPVPNQDGSGNATVDSYILDEDSGIFRANDPTGTSGFANDDGIVVNDFDAEGGTLTVILIDAPLNAKQFVLNNDGTFEYTPADNFFGTDTFTYRLSDGVLTSTTVGTVTLVVRPENDAPIGGNDPIFLLEDEVATLTASQLLANDRPGPANESGETLTILGVSTSQRGGTVSFANGTVTYRPPTNFSGTDSFTYVIGDNGLTNGLLDPKQATVTVNITIRDQNDAPSAVNDTGFNVNEDAILTRPVTELLANDNAGPANEQATQTIRLVGVTGLSSAGGTVTLSQGNFVYRPKLDFVGQDTFTYTIEDNGTSEGIADPKQAIGTVTINVTGVNDIPRVLNPMGTVNVDEDGSLQAIDLSTVFFDPDVLTSQDLLTYTVTNSNTSLVTAAITNGQLSLQLRPDQHGTATIRVEATDRAGQKISNTLTLNVRAMEDSPRIVLPIPDRSIDEDSASVTIPISPQYLFDPDVASNGDTLTLRIESNSNPSLITPRISGNNIIVDVAANAFGLSTITVSATDARGNTVSDTFNVLVNAVNDAAETKDDIYTVQQGGRLVTTDVTGTATTTLADDGVLANDTDSEGDVQTAELVAGPTRGTLVLNPNGTFTYTPTGTTGQTDTFTYRAVDSNGVQSRITQVRISIGNPAPPPHQNPINALDVTADNRISPIDALVVINYLNQNGAGPVPTGVSPPPYRDVSGNNRIEPQDVLIILNYLNGGGSGEGESDPLFVGGHEEVPSVLDVPSSMSNLGGSSLQSGGFAGIQPRRDRESVLASPALTLADYLEAVENAFADTWVEAIQGEGSSAEAEGEAFNWALDDLNVCRSVEEEFTEE